MQIALLGLWALASALFEPAETRPLHVHTRSGQQGTSISARTAGTVPLDSLLQILNITHSKTPIKSHSNQAITAQLFFKKEKCRTSPMTQVVHVKGCLQKKIANNFCSGQCNSVFIPMSARQDKTVDAFMPCGFCRPRQLDWIVVKLRCPTKHGMRYRQKHVQYVKDCRCMTLTVSPASLWEVTS